MEQLNHYNTNFTKRTFPIILVCDNISKASNIGSLFRTADAFGVEQIIFCGVDSPISRKMTKTSRATEKTVKYDVSESISETILKLKAKNYDIFALEITSKSKAIHQFKFSNAKPIALVIGDENFGVSEGVLNASNHIIHIDMYGKNSSMNVAQACTIALYEMSKQLI